MGTEDNTYDKIESIELTCIECGKLMVGHISKKKCYGCKKEYTRHKAITNWRKKKEYEKKNNIKGS